MRSDQCDDDVAESRVRGDVGRDRAEDLAGVAQADEEVAREAEVVDKVPRPVAGGRVEQAGRRGVRPLRGRTPSSQ